MFNSVFQMHSTRAILLALSGHNLQVSFSLHTFKWTMLWKPFCIFLWKKKFNAWTFMDTLISKDELKSWNVRQVSHRRRVLLFSSEPCAGRHLGSHILSHNSDWAALRICKTLYWMRLLRGHMACWLILNMNSVQTVFPASICTKQLNRQNPQRGSRQTKRPVEIQHWNCFLLLICFTVRLN